MVEGDQGFGDRLASCRQLAGLSQQELAERSGLSARTVGNLERGRVRWPHPDTVRRLADALGLRGQARNEFIVGAARLLAGQACGGVGTAAPDPAPAPGGRYSPGPGSGVPVPRQLPLAVRGFTGRKAELDFLARLTDGPGPGCANTVVISAIGGTAGVGKTTLALHWAHQVAGLFPDGQLYVNLRGFDPSGIPATPAEAVRGFLNALGVPPERIPAGHDAQEGLYRSLLAERAMLIVLDNARDEAQVRPLVPASPASVVLITSRSQLVGLAAADGARLLTLDVLTHREAVQLLTARIGRDRAAAAPAAVDEIARLCAHLPLALAVTAARAAARPRLPLTELTAELRDAAGRLDALDAGEAAASVTAVFSWSCRQLSPAAARMFRLLGVHPGPDISIPAAASLAGTGQPEARRLLGELARGCLITEHAPGRYAFHDLLRAYAARQAEGCETQRDRDAAARRVLGHYLHTAARAAALLRPSQEQFVLDPPRPGTCPERLADHRQALAWFGAEHQVLLAAVAFAAETGADRDAWQLPCAMNIYLYWRGYRQARVAVMASAVAAAVRDGDAPGQAMSLRYLGSACTDTRDYDQARAHLEHCLLLYRQLGDRMGEGWTQRCLSVLAGEQGRYADSLGHTEQGLRLFQAVGHEVLEAEMLNGVAWSHALVGDYEQARVFCEHSLKLIAKLGGCQFEGDVWDTLGYIEFNIGEFTRAADHFEFALALCHDRGDRSGEAAILTHIGNARHAASELPKARRAWQRALAIYDDLQHPRADEVRAKLASIEGDAPGS
jgi:tetratricopeptide (TPR) repeat protein/DNA-binding XRE family transcriptional regulator